MERAAILYSPLVSEPASSHEAALRLLADLEVVAVVNDGDGPPRGALTEALQRIAAGEASVLVTPRLQAVATSLRELVALLDWLEEAGAGMVALDVRLDTSTSAGGRMVTVLREVAGWEQDRPGGPRRGRPGLATHAPELGERIKGMRREQDLSLQAIADALNAEGVPTPRGGAKWRPSSVQAALGYRRPPPPPPGAPHPPGHHRQGHKPPRPPDRGSRP
jgi:DNA invertase Pin-like site-specific DNA recombinase